MVVRGPLEMRCTNGYTCGACGKKVEAGSVLFLGRAAGRGIHACSQECFDALVGAAGRVAPPVPDFVKNAVVDTHGDVAV